MEQELPSLLQTYELRGKQPFVSDFSLLLRHAIEKGRGPILYIKKTGPHGEHMKQGIGLDLSNMISFEASLIFFVKKGYNQVIDPLYHCIFSAKTV